MGTEIALHMPRAEFRVVSIELASRTRRAARLRVRENRPCRAPGSSLIRKQPRILARAVRDQLVVGAALHHSPRVQDDDLVAVSDRRQPVRDDQARAASPAQVVVDDPLGLGIERARGLVEDRAGSARRTSARAICSRWRWPPEKFRPCLADSRAIAAAPLKQIAVNRRLHPGLRQPLHRNEIVPERQVVAHRPLEQADLRVNQLAPS